MTDPRQGATSIRRFLSVGIAGLLLMTAAPVAAAGDRAAAQVAAAEVGMFAEPLLTGEGTSVTIGAVETASVRILPGFPRTIVVDTDTAEPEAATVNVRLTPEIETIRLRPRPKRGPFRMNLYRKGDFLSQQTEYWCVSASLQTMFNIIEDGEPRRSPKYQRKLHFEARDLDTEQDGFWRRMTGEKKWKAGLHGLGLTDWTQMLDEHGHGPYEIDRSRTLRNAIHKAAKSLRMTGKPVGLVVWRGAHAWVMSGFTATADPALTSDFEVKEVFIQDPWYPRVSSIWGRSRPPNSLVPVGRLDEDFLRYDRPRRSHPKRDGKFIIIEPVLPPNVRVR